MSDKPRRPKGTGSIKREYFRGTDRKDIATKLARAIAERDSGLVYDAENMTVGEYLDRWLDAIRGSLRERTWQRHEEITRIHLKPNIGKIKLDRLSALQVQSLYRLYGTSPYPVVGCGRTLVRSQRTIKDAMKSSRLLR